MIPALSLVDNPDGGKTWSVSIQILMLMTALTLLPSLLLAATSFTRIVIVLAILRQAIGMPQTPPNQVLVGLALFLTFFIMAPGSGAREPGRPAALSGRHDRTARGGRQGARARCATSCWARPASRTWSCSPAWPGKEGFEKPEDVPLSVLLPSFLTSELKTAFQIGFLTFIPFLVIDLVVSSVLMSMGMMMLSPMLISLPFKIMLFVLVDGWGLIVGTLAASFVPHN